MPNKLKRETTDELFRAILSLKDLDECYEFFEDLCMMKELADMAQRIETAQMLLAGKTYEQIVKSVEISTATISRINRCIQYGNGGYALIVNRLKEKEQVGKTKKAGRIMRPAFFLAWGGRVPPLKRRRIPSPQSWGRNRRLPASSIG